MAAAGYHVILNSDAGTANSTGVTAEALQALFEQNGMVATIDADRDTSLDARIAKALASAAPVVVAAGGDGTITAIAQAMVGTDKTLAILPLGTVNALAKDLEVPLDLAAAVNAVATGTAQRIDVGEVNGRIFLHKVVIGLIPGMAAGREHIRGRYDASAKIGFLRYFFRRLARSKRMAVSIQPSEGASRVERVQAIAVASNAYDEGFGRFFHRQSLDKGTLTLYVLKRFTAVDFLRLTSGMLLGRWRQDDALSIEPVNAVTINSRKSLLKVMFDGEVMSLETPLEFRIRPLALSVITPDTEAAAETKTESPADQLGATGTDPQ